MTAVVVATFLLPLIVGAVLGEYMHHRRSRARFHRLPAMPRAEFHLDWRNGRPVVDFIEHDAVIYGAPPAWFAEEAAAGLWVPEVTEDRTVWRPLPGHRVAP